MDVEEILEKIWAEKMVELKIKEKEIEELNKGIRKLEKEVKEKTLQLDETMKKNQKLSVALKEIYVKLWIRCSVGDGIFKYNLK